MSAIFSDEVYHISMVTNPPIVNSLGVQENEKAGVRWFHCREQFAKAFFQTTDTVLFTVDRAEHFQRVADFLDRAETVLRLGLHDSPEEALRLLPPSTFHKTDRPSVMAVKPSPFWLSGEMRRQVLTAVLKSFVAYRTSDGNFEQALMSKTYLSTNPDATTRFFAGFTEFVDNKQAYGEINSVGWQAWSAGRNRERIRKQLIRTTGAAPLFFGMTDCLVV